MRATMMKGTMMKSVAALIVKGDEILLEKRTFEPFKGKWVLPGGHIDKGEDVESAIVREVKEETGLDFFDYNFVKQYPEVFPEIDWNCIVYVFVGDAEGELKHDKESEELRFVAIKEIDGLDMGFDHKRIIKEVLI